MPEAVPWVGGTAHGCAVTCREQSLTVLCLVHPWMSLLPFPPARLSLSCSLLLSGLWEVSGSQRRSTLTPQPSHFLPPFTQKKGVHYLPSFTQTWEQGPAAGWHLVQQTPILDQDSKELINRAIAVPHPINFNLIKNKGGLHC